MVCSPGVRMQVAEEQFPPMACRTARQQVDVGSRAGSEGEVVQPRPAAVVDLGQDVRTGFENDVAVCTLPAGTGGPGITARKPKTLQQPAQAGLSLREIPDPDLDVVETPGCGTPV